MADEKEKIYWDIPRIPENDPIYRPDLDREWEKEEEELREQEKAEARES